MNHFKSLTIQFISQFGYFIDCFFFQQIPLNNTNFDSTLNSTIDTSIGANSTKVDDSVVDDDNGDADAESDTKDETTEIVQEDEATPDAVEVST